MFLKECLLEPEIGGNCGDIKNTPCACGNCEVLLKYKMQKDELQKIRESVIIQDISKRLEGLSKTEIKMILNKVLKTVAKENQQKK